VLKVNCSQLQVWRSEN